MRSRCRVADVAAVRGMDAGEDRTVHGPETDSRPSNGHSEPDCHPPVEEEEEDVPQIDIHVTNVVSDFSLRCHLNLRHIATNGSNVIYKREQGAVFMRLRNPTATASIRSSGRITVTGNTSEEDGKKAARRVSRVLQKMGFKVRLSGFRIVNVLAIVNLPFGIKLVQLAEAYPKICSYEPELHPGATYYWREQKATFKIFQTGAITVTAPNIATIELAVQHIYPIVYDFQKAKPADANAKRKREEEEVEDEAAPTGRSRKRIKRLKRQKSCDSSEESDGIVPDDEGEEADPLTSEEEAVMTTDSDDEESGDRDEV